ncbi:MAG TPA: hypothetical protein VNZ48_10640 [Xanthobacteraceae bacterium]|jgi:hypothetical protein|nr:hypothetical protein [Xanthobacteraceae bacterium]
MRHPISALTALGLAVAAGPTVASAQTVISGQPVETVITQPVQTIETTETVRTVRPATRLERKRVVTTTRRTVVTQRAMAAQPLYDVVPPAPAPVVTRTYAPPLYDVAAPAPVVDDTVVAPLPPAIAPIPVYRYVYEPDRILVVDPVTNIAIQSIPR